MQSLRECGAQAPFLENLIENEFLTYVQIHQHHIWSEKWRYGHVSLVTTDLREHEMFFSGTPYLQLCTWLEIKAASPCQSALGPPGKSGYFIPTDKISNSYIYVDFVLFYWR